MAASRRIASRYTLALVAALGAGVAPSAPCAEIHANPSNYRALLRGLKPGDTLLLEPGVYREGLPLHNVKGTPEHPIRIGSAAKGQPAEFVARAGRNTVSLSNTAHVRISGLMLNGDNQEVDAVKAEGHKACTSVHHILLEDLLIVGHGVDQSIVGIASFCPAWNWVIRRNIIVGAGTGLYLGNSDGSAPFVGGLIEQNLFVDSRGYNMQIKHQLDRSAGIGPPAQQARTLIRHNIFTKVHNASAGINARPSLLLGHFPRAGAGSDDVYEVSHNLFFCSPGESLIQAEGNVSLTRNILINPDGNAVSIQPHNDIPKNMDIRQNFVAASGRGVWISEKPSSYVQRVTGNSIFSPVPAVGGQQAANRVAAFEAAAPALAPWMVEARDSAKQPNEFAPLIDIARRLCGNGANEPLRGLPGVPENLNHHPVCQIIQRLSSMATKPAMRTGADTAAHAAEPERCVFR